MSSAPTLVFLDDGPWISFNQMAARLRGKRCTTLRITYDQTLASRWPNLLLYDQSVVVAPGQQPPPLDDLVGRGPIVDIQCAEPLLEVAESLAKNSVSLTTAALERLQTRIFFGDKLSAMDRLHEKGVPVPSHVSGQVATPDVAIETLGLPLVVKPRRGAAGADVVIARDAAAVRRAVDGTLTRDRALFEQFIDGEQLSYSAAFLDGAVLQEAIYERERDDAGSLSPLGSLRTLDDETLAALGSQVVAAIGGSGLVDLDVLRDRDGKSFVVDVNLRAWHSLGALLDAGVDFLDGYLRVIGMTTEVPRTRRTTPGVEVRLSLLRRRVPGEGRSLAPVIRWFVAASLHRIRMFGIRYWSSELLTHAFAMFSKSAGVVVEKP